MKNHLILILLFLLILSGSVAAHDGARIKFDVFQHDPVNQNDHMIYSDSAEVEVGRIISGFIGPFSIDLELLAADSVRAEFNSQIVTLGPTANTFAKHYTVEYTLPARIEPIEGKNKTQYLLIITPLAPIDIDTSICPYDHHNKDDFMTKPTAHTDISYVPSSLGDFYFDSIKELMETSYRQYRAFLNLNIPGKTHIYISPCPINSVIWDKRFGTSIDPTRNTAFAVYNKDFNTADPFILNHVVTLRTYGYAPPVLSEGLANYFSFAIFDMKKILKDKTDIPFNDLFDTYSYLESDPRIADRTATTFVRYLVDEYSLSKFLKLYDEADDLNLKSLFPKYYDKSLDDLRLEWETYVDTVTIPPMMYYAFSTEAEVMLNYKLSNTYNLGYLNAAKTQDDSLRALDLLKRSSFFLGNYYKAAEYQQELLKVNDTNATGWMALGSYEMMNGEYDKSLKDFQKAESLDTASQMIKFNLALYYVNRGDDKKARELLMTNFSNDKGSSAQGESRVLLANILKNSKNKSDREQAGKYFLQAVNMYKGLLEANPSAPSTYMWLGIAHLGLYEYDKAINNLHIAEFIESRPFYVGMIQLWLGKAYLAAGNKEEAKKYFSKVFSTSSAVYHQDEAKKLLEELD